MSEAALIVSTATADFEDFTDEIVVIDSNTGAFYSLKGRAIPLWRAWTQGLQPQRLDDALAVLEEYEQDLVRTMVQELETAGILVRDERPVQGVLDWGDFPPASFIKSNDFDDLIRLDPIHDVSDQGWPHR